MNETKITKYLMVLMIIVQALALIWGGHEYGKAKGQLLNGSRALDIIESNVFTPASSSNEGGIDPQCLTDLGF